MLLFWRWVVTILEIYKLVITILEIYKLVVTVLEIYKLRLGDEMGLLILLQIVKVFLYS